MANYVLLEKITVGAAGASSVTFSGIPQTGYTDLVIRGSVRTTQGATYGLLSIRPNGSTSNITGIRMYAGDGNVYSDNTPTLAFISGDATGANTFGSFETYITNYASSSFKTFTSQSTGERNQTNDTYMGTSAILWSNTTAITSLEIMPNAVGFIPGSTFYLYGVAKLGTTPAIAPKALGGDVVLSTGTHWYHICNTSGTFIPSTPMTCDYLVVAGGGGAGANGAGGGGAGGLRSTVTATGGGGTLETPLSLTAQAYTVTIGAGGAGGGTAGGGTTGNNSVFSTITSNGGGGGGSNAGPIGGKNGGSGGGENNTPLSGVGAGTANQGFNGGSGGANGGGGGGGAGEAGNTDGHSYGGDGVDVSITGSSITYAGGGGGFSNIIGNTAPGGTGGGGTVAPNQDGIANLGGGGGAWNGSSVAGNGGSGVVIVRYAV